MSLLKHRGPVVSMLILNEIVESLYLLGALAVLGFEILVFRFKVEVLAFKNRKLILENRKLILKKREMITEYGSRTMFIDKFFDGVK